MCHGSEAATARFPRTAPGSADPVGERDHDAVRSPHIRHPHGALVDAYAADQAIALGGHLLEDGVDIGKFINEKVANVPGIVRSLTTLTFKAF